MNYPVLSTNYHVHRDPHGGMLFSSNGPLTRGTNVNLTAAMVLERCTGSKTISEICTELSKGDFDQEYKLITLFLLEAKQRGIVDFYEAPHPSKISIKGSFEYCVPLFAAIELTYQCNLKCRHCYAPTGEVADERFKSLPTPYLLSILSALSDAGTRLIQLTGGEPLMHPDFLKILAFCSEHFNYITITTNGTLIDEEIAKKICAYPNVGSIQISLDGPKFHDSFRGREGAFKEAKRGISFLAKRIPLSVGMSVTPQNMEEIEDTLRLAISLGAKRFVPSSVMPVGRAKNGELVLSIEKTKTIGKLVEDLRLKYRGRIYVDSPKQAAQEIKPTDEAKICGAAFRQCTILPTGEVRPCLLMSSEKLYYGNLSKDAISDVFSHHIVEVFRDITPPSLEICGDCQDVVYCGGCIAAALSRHLSGLSVDCKWVKQSKLLPLIEVK